MATFQKLSDTPADQLSDADFVTLITGTTLQEPVLTDLQTLGPFKVILYQANT